VGLEHGEDRAVGAARLHRRRGRSDPKELNNPQVEPIVKKYLELRYRLLPYTYTIARECCDTGCR
jgi:alpha-glucosidase (family GH31 glycosyl hydrolase)